MSKTVKQLQLVHSDDVAARLVELWRYENARGVEVRAAAAAACPQANPRTACPACLPARPLQGSAPALSRGSGALEAGALPEHQIPRQP